MEQIADNQLLSDEIAQSLSDLCILKTELDLLEIDYMAFLKDIYSIQCREQLQLGDFAYPIYTDSKHAKWVIKQIRSNTEPGSRIFILDSDGLMEVYYAKGVKHDFTYLK